MNPWVFFILGGIFGAEICILIYEIGRKSPPS
jgi:hypothetical protein